MMHSYNKWSEIFEMHMASRLSTNDDPNRDSQLTESDRSSIHMQPYHHHQQSWLLESDQPHGEEKYVDLCCIFCKRSVFRLTVCVLFSVLLVSAVIAMVVVFRPKHEVPEHLPDEYTVALRKALLFFNAQRSGRLPEQNGVQWRGDSGLQDGLELPDVKGGLVGGYYDGGDNIKYHFPMAFSMTLLSWSVIEYGHKYKAIGEYDHIRDIIKWGTDYLLQTFNSSASTISQVHSQVGVAPIGSNGTKDDNYCWQRPENMTGKRPVQTNSRGTDLGGEMAAALAAASIVFLDEPSYSQKLADGAKSLYEFALSSPFALYSSGNPAIYPFYNSTGYWDELIWSSTWMYFATGDPKYISLATDHEYAVNADAFSETEDSRIFGWDNKLPGIELLLTRLRIFLNPGYPYEDMLRSYHNMTDLSVCSDVYMLGASKHTEGGLILLKPGEPRPLQHIVNAAFLVSLYADYLNASNIPGLYCGSDFITTSTLRSFAAYQVNYILGSNPMNMSYVVGHGQRYPRHVHHRGASIPANCTDCSCSGGKRWLEAETPDPNIIYGAMVGGPDVHDGFSDVRTIASFTEPTMAANAGLAAALVSLAIGDQGIDRNAIFTGVTPFDDMGARPPPPPWTP